MSAPKTNYSEKFKDRQQLKNQSFSDSSSTEAYAGAYEQSSPYGNLVSLGSIPPQNMKNKVALRKRKKSKHPLREFRIKRGFTLEELAELTRLSPSYLSRLESGTRRLNADVLHRLALVLSCHPGDLLMHDSHSSRFISQSNTLNEQTSIAMVPQDLPLYVLNTENNLQVIDFEYTTEWLPRPPELLGVPGSFAFAITDDTLGQRYRKNDHVYVHPNKSLTPGCSILVVTRNDQALVGQFVNWKNDTNPIADTLVIRLIERIGHEDCFKEVSLSKNTIKATYRIIGIMEAA
ncbi:MAG: helix-turn-helix domain-containing protein [Candidatus Nucleicultricaceae bacterium]